MYTQCPDCGISFRVTAEALKQAAGKVRCGGCGNAFNALAYLSETKPDKATRIEVDESLPELTPEPSDDDSDAPPVAISPEQSAALLKTLDDLAGEDVRLKDTGVEWRVLDDEDEPGNDADSDPGKDVDQVLENSPTEVDEFLTKTPTKVDASEIFRAPEPSDVDVAEVFEEADKAASQTKGEELRFDDDTGLPDDFDFEIQSPPPVLDEEPESETDETAEPDDAQVDLAIGDPDEWGELLDEVDDGKSPVEANEPAAGDIPTDEKIPADVVSAADEDMLDIDTQFGMQAEAMGIDISGTHETVDEEKPASDPETSIDEDLIAAAFESEGAEKVDQVEEGDSFTDTENLDVRLEDVLETVSVKTKDSDGQAAPTPTDDENLEMQIDAELLSVAVEDEHGFASTIVMHSDELEKKGLESQDNVDVPEDTVVLDDKCDVQDDTVVLDDKGDVQDDIVALEEEASDAEEIIMSGKFSRNADEAKETDLDRQKKDGALDHVKRPHTDAPKIEGGTRASLSSSMAIAVAVLAVLLAGQIVHQSRAALATSSGIGSAITPIYRAIGAPIAPGWDVTGWRFEVSKGDTSPAGGTGSAEDEEILTIYSRVGNKSESPLPYPLISVALTDRFEDIIGSKVLEPREYLSGEFDPSIPVAAGDTFNAVISIDTPAPAATGFKLNVCYRESGELLRCAIDDFK